MLVDHWPASLKEFVLTLKSLVYPREQADLKKVFPNFNTAALNSVLAQGMNLKKKHEVEVLSAIVSSVASAVRANAVIDVGAGQHSFVAIDACSHHGNVTNARAERIKKHYMAQMRKLGSGKKRLNVPQTITCNIMSLETLKSLTTLSPHEADVVQPKSIEQDLELGLAGNGSSLVLAGLHACGDPSEPQCWGREVLTAGGALSAVPLLQNTRDNCRTAATPCFKLLLCVPFHSQMLPFESGHLSALHLSCKDLL
ncbi:NAC domain-containing protein 21/22-like [Hibiscus syriacus]|uniref:NAC domain-containing protein 21/22-like n=1 Tax=Hibiscus syriacus TaxID=106335 RepID=A0A6A2ZIB0_HIBSY|nr:NAC domain-containing protein 21/22-like [Hibiscus syriacus]